MDRDLRDWIRSLAVLKPRQLDEQRPAQTLSDDAADRLARMATDGTLKAVLGEIAASEPELAG